MDDIVRDFLGDQASASELKEMREALEERLRRLRVELEADPGRHDELRQRMQQVQRQIHALAEEEAISGFVEDTVRASVVDTGPLSADAPPHDARIPPWASIDIDDTPED